MGSSRISADDKKRIAEAKAFAHFVPDEQNTDVDHKMEQIRRGLEAGLGKDVDFYDPGVRRLWDLSASGRWPSASGRWDKYLGRALEYLHTGQLQEYEIDYKLDLEGKLTEARHGVLGKNDGWADLVKNAVSDSKNNIVYWGNQDKFKKWVARSPGDALSALRAIWERGDSPVFEWIRAFSKQFPESVIRGSGVRTNVMSYLVMGLDAAQYPPFQVTLLDNAYKAVGYDQPPHNTDEAALYKHALGFFDRFIEEAQARDIPVRHRLDAQSLVWAIRNEYIQEVPRKKVPGLDLSDLQALADKLRLSVEFLREIRILLYDKKQIIFQGPPGTGKTYVAQKLANHLAQSQERVTLVQLHPSYAYEDFVQGFRPTLMDGQPAFALRNGPLLQAAERARQDQAAKHFLVIDEINRGNVAKVFGELYFLLEYRDERMRLQYSDQPFVLPSNLYMIGTMNTADRSIALVDLALRRRFCFVSFHPDEEPVKGLLRRWLRDKAPEMEWVADVVERANAKPRLKEDRHAAIGPSYFMKEHLDEVGVERIWRHSVLPYIEERLFGDADLLGDFNLGKLRGEVDSAGGSRRAPPSR